MKTSQFNRRRAVPFFFVAVLAMVSGCGRKAAVTSGVVQIHKIGALEYGVVDGSKLSFSGDSVSGSGKLIFRNPLPEEDNRFDLTVLMAAGGSMNLTINSDAGLKGGVGFHLARNAQNRIVAGMALAAESQDLSSYYDGVDASKPLHLQFEVHPHGHLKLGPSGNMKEFNFQSHPAGAFWGVELTSSNLTSAAVLKADEE